MELINLPTKSNVLDHRIIEPPTYREGKGIIGGQELKAGRANMAIAQQEVRERRETVKR